MREFVVDEQGEDMEQGDYQHQQYHQTIPNRNFEREPQKTAESSRKRVEILCGMTQLSKNIEVGENSFVIKSLKTRDNREALLAAVKFDGTVEFPFELKKQILARSLTSVSGIDIEMFLGNNSFKSRLDFIDELDEALADRLYQEYLNLTKEIKDKYSIKTQDDLKEVSEDIKK